MSADKPRSRRRTLLIILGALFLVCAAVSALTSFFSNSDSEPAAQADITAVVDVGDEATGGPTSAPATDEPTAAPTNTPAPTDTPVPTNTPRPTEVPTPEPSPTPLPEPILLTGSGDSILDVEKWDGPAIIHVTGNAGSRHFALINYDVDGNQIDLLVNTTSPYDGVRPLDFFDNDDTARLEVTATGDWTIEISPLIQAPPVVVPGSTTGAGDAVLILSNAADIATITGNANAQHFAVQSYGGSADLLVNTTEPYSGQVQLGPQARILVITAAGDWTLDLTAR